MAGFERSHVPRSFAIRSSRSFRRFWGVALTSCALLSSSLCFAQTAEEKAGARSAANAGADAFEAGNFEQAIDLFQRAESVIHSPVHELYIARSMSKVGRLVEARELLLKISRENEADIAAEANAEIEALEPRMPRVTLNVSGQGGGALQLTLDERPFPAALVGIAQPMDPGEHEISVTDGERRMSKAFSLKEGSAEMVEIDLSQGELIPAATVEPAEGSESDKAEGQGGVATGTSGSGANGLRVGSYVAMGVGLAGLGVGTVFSLQAGGHAKDANDLCDEIDAREGTTNCAGRTEAEQSQVTGMEDKHKSAKTISIVGFAAGGALLATGVVLFILSKPKSTESVRRNHPKVDPVVGLGYLGVRGSF